MAPVESGPSCTGPACPASHGPATRGRARRSFYLCCPICLLTVCLFFRLSLLRSVKGERFERTGGATSGKNGELLYLLFVRIHTNCVFFCICRQACRRHRLPVSAVSGSSDGRRYEWKNGELLYLFFVRVHPNCIFCVCLPPGLSMTSPFGLGRSERPQAIFERPPGGARPQDFRPGATGL